MIDSIEGARHQYAEHTYLCWRCGEVHGVGRERAGVTGGETPSRRRSFGNAGTLGAGAPALTGGDRRVVLIRNLRRTVVRVAPWSAL